MAKGKRAKEQQQRRGAAQAAAVPELAKKPLAIARVLSVVLLLLGVVMLILGGGVLAGRITEGWGFPMSAVPNWGRPWGAVLMFAGGAYVVCPILLFLRPRKGTVAMMIVAGLSVLVGTPLITTTTEIFYNLLADTDCLADWTTCRPDWVDSVWGYFMILNVAVIVAVYRADSGPEHQAETLPAKS